MKPKQWSGAVCGVLLIVAGVLIATGVIRTEARIGGGSGGGVVETHAGGQEPERIWRERRGELLEVSVDGRHLEKLAGRGRLYVEAVKGAEYELVVRNPFPVRVAVALSVDGLNTIDARRTTRWDSSKWVIEPYQTIRIGGWQMSGERARRFYFTDERDSYANKLGRASDLGVISAVFFRERTSVTPLRRTRPYPGGEPRRDERGAEQSDDAEAPSKAQSAGAASSQPRKRAAIPSAPAPSSAPDDDYAATGIGRSVRHDVRWTHLDLDPRPAAEVTLRYEYHDALVRLGVLPRYPRPAPDPLGRRERSRGFEDPRYSPEP